MSFIEPDIPTMEYRSAHTRARWVVALLLVYVAVACASFVSSVYEIGLLTEINSGGRIAIAKLDAADERRLVFAIATLAIFVLTGIVWLVWQHRAHANLRGLELRFSPARAVGSWFVPLANFAWPDQAMSELWRASTGRPDWSTNPTSALIGWWWGFYLARALSALGYFRLPEETLAQFLTAAYVLAG